MEHSNASATEEAEEDVRKSWWTMEAAIAEETPLTVADTMTEAEQLHFEHHLLVPMWSPTQSPPASEVGSSQNTSKWFGNIPTRTPTPGERWARRVPPGSRLVPEDIYADHDALSTDTLRAMVVTPPLLKPMDFRPHSAPPRGPPRYHVVHPRSALGHHASAPPQAVARPYESDAQSNEAALAAEVTESMAEAFVSAAGAATRTRIAPASNPHEIKSENDAREIGF